MVKKIFFSVFALTVVVFSIAMVQFFKSTNENKELRVQTANVVIYTHSSFMDVYGPGPELKTEFEKSCDCTVDYVDGGGTDLIIEKMKLDPSRRVDLILGLDHLQLSKVAQSIRLQSLPKPAAPLKSELIPFVYDKFLPYDWSPMGFIYRQSESKPFSSISEALAKMPESSLTLQDPEVSSPGLEFLYWLFVQPEGLDVMLQKASLVAHSYSPSWSTAYGLFKKKQAKFTFSYLTSLVYHWQEEKDRDYQFMVFDHGHPAQIEYAAVPDSCWNCGAAKKFVGFLLTPEAQKILAQKNYMFPVREDVELAPEFSELPKVKVLGPERLDDFTRGRPDHVLRWRKVSR